MILITGGNGVVGFHLALALLKLHTEQNRGEKIRVMGLSPAGSDFVLRQSGVELHYGDVTREDDADKAAAGADTIFHLAAVLSSPENPARYREVNVEGTHNLLAAAKRHGAKRFIFVSSISVIYPRRNAYSASKAEAEGLVRQAGIPFVIARPCLVLGGLEHKAFEAAVLKWPLLFLPRRGAARKRPLHAQDLAERLAGLSEESQAMGKTVTLGGREVITLRELAESILCDHQLRKRIWPVPQWVLRIVAAGSQGMARMSGRRISWLSQQSVDGLVYDAVPETDEA